MTTGAQTPLPPARPKRSRLRTFLPLGVAAWFVLEIWLLMLVAGATSGLVVFFVLLAGLVLGSVVIKRAGRRAFRKLSETLQQQQSGVMPDAARPGSEGNGLMMLGGLLLIIPGLASDAVGLLLLLPPVQKAVSRSAERTFERKLSQARPGTLGGAFQQARMHQPDGKVVQGEVIRDEPRGDAQPPRPPLTH
ncbi:FxsA family membrane protein [Streptomyces collinus]|uniref:FxsA family membrane protein n=1 Tax=Streptomyces collinus TaxID=42684 RepID=UPI00378809AB